MMFRICFASAGTDVREESVPFFDETIVIKRKFQNTLKIDKYIHSLFVLNLDLVVLQKSKKCFHLTTPREYDFNIFKLYNYMILF